MTSYNLSLRSMNIQAHSRETYRWNFGQVAEAHEYVAETSRRAIPECCANNQEPSINQATHWSAN